MRYLLLPVLAPLLGALAALLLPRAWRGAKSLIGVLGALATFVGALALLENPARWAGPEFALGDLRVVLSFGVDAMSRWAVLIAAGMGLLCTLYSLGWFRGSHPRPAAFDGLVLLSIGGACGVLLSGNLLVLVVCWEVVTVALYLLVSQARPEAGGPGARAFMLLGIGDMALLLAVILIGVSGAAGGHSLSTTALAAAPLDAGSGTGLTVFLLVLVAASVKAGVMPFHGWVPSIAATTDAPVMALLPASLDKLLGIYLLARLMLEWTVPTEGLRMLVMLLGALTVLAAVLLAMVQHDLRKLLAYHVISQVGYMVLGIGTGTWIGVMGGLFHLVNHVLYKSCLFFGAGSVERAAGTTELDRLGGLGRAMPLTFAAMFVASLAIAGIPPLNGFASKWMVYQGCLVAGRPFLLIVALFGSVLTLASFVKVLHSAFWGPHPARLAGARENGLAFTLPMGVLATACVAFGLFAGWPLDHWFGPAVGLGVDGDPAGSAALTGDPRLLAPIGALGTEVARFATASMRPLPLALLLATGALVALFVAHLGATPVRRIRSVFIGGEPIDPEVNTFPGTGFYETVRAMPGLRTFYALAESGRFDPWRLGSDAGRPVIFALRRLHTGLLGDYLSWCVSGLVVLMVVLLWR